jgi:nucleotide-binding universal stress UspA family protein
MKILVALDLTQSSDTVLAKAVETAKAQNAGLEILVVAENFSEGGDVFDYGNINEQLLGAAKAAAKRYQEKAKVMGMEAGAAVMSGQSPADVIVKHAETGHADLIILGRRAKKGLDRFIIGSVAQRVVAHAPCSVLVVR